MSNHDRPTCETCYFFDALNSECHRFPPQVSGQYIHGRWFAPTFFQVQKSTWCGEHKPAEPVT